MALYPIKNLVITHSEVTIGPPLGQLLSVALNGTDDFELASALDIARRARCTVHVRGTDKNPVIELKDKLSRAIVGGSELKRRLKDAR